MFKDLAKIDAVIRQQRAERMFNEYRTIDDLPLTTLQKECVLEWFARKITKDACKSYDPLMIEGNIAHSYVFELEDGGRHHSFKDLAHLEQMLESEMREELSQQPD